MSWLSHVINIFKETGSTKDDTKTYSPPKETIRIQQEPDFPKSFGYKMSWLTIKTNDTEKIAEVLKLNNVKKANWSSGLDAIYHSEQHLFVTPSIQGWSFTVGDGFPDIGNGHTPQEFTRYLEKIGEHFEEVQYFGTHRVVEYHAWARVIQGQLIRGYAYIGERGETPWNEGEKTPEEKELGIEFFHEDSPEAQDDAYWDREDLTYPDEEYVMQLASRWSISPITLDQLDQNNLNPSIGIVGRFGG